MEKPHGPRMVRVQEQDHGRTLRLSTGDQLIVTLETQPGTGFTWNLAPDSTPLLELQGKPEIESGAGTAGRTDRITFRFTVRAKGEGKLELHYLRSWEKKAPMRVFQLQIKVQ